MLKHILQSALRGIVRQVAQDLAVDPERLELKIILDDGEHLLASVNAERVATVTRTPSRRRILRFQMGQVAYDIDIGGGE